MKKDDYTQLNIDRGNRLLSLRKYLRLSRVAVEEQSPLSSRNLQNWETGRTSMTESSLADVVEFYKAQGINCTPEWIAYGVGESPLKELKQQQTHQHAISTPPNDKLFIQDELMLFHKHYPAAIDTVITDTSMQPIYYPQDIVAGIQTTGDDIDKLIGEICIVKTIDKGLLVRKIKAGTDGHRYDLYKSHPKEKIAEQVTDVFSAARIVWVRRQISS